MQQVAKGVSFQQLRYLQGVAEAGSFTGAARLLKVSQPALSGQLRLLERTLGIALFKRERRRILLTPAGLTVQRFAIDIEAKFDALLRQVGAAPGTRLGRARSR